MKITNQDVEAKLREVRKTAATMVAMVKKARKVGDPLPREQLKTGILWALHNGAVLTLGAFNRRLKPEPSVREGVQTGTGSTLVAYEPVSGLDFRSWSNGLDAQYEGVCLNALNYIIEFVDYSVDGIRPPSRNWRNFRTVTSKDGIGKTLSVLN